LGKLRLGKLRLGKLGLGELRCEGFDAFEAGVGAAGEVSPGVDSVGPDSVVGF
jgi:hypothetical protein